MNKPQIILFLFSLICFISSFSLSQNHLNILQKSYIKSERVKDYSFVVYNPKVDYYNSLIMNSDSIKKFAESWFFNFDNTLPSFYLKEKNPKIDKLVAKNKILNLDSLIKNSVEISSDYKVFEQTINFLMDSIKISKNILENNLADLEEIIHKIIYEHHGENISFKAMTFSDLVWYGKYGFQILYEYNFLISNHTPVSFNLAVFKKNMFGKVKEKRYISSVQLY